MITADDITHADEDVSHTNDDVIHTDDVTQQHVVWSVSSFHKYRVLVILTPICRWQYF